MKNFASISSVALPTVAVSVVPVTGQLVDLRRRRFVVQDVSRSALEPSVLWEGVPALTPQMRSMTGPHHIVTLVSVEDDGLGEIIEVIWEREAGAQVLERPAMPVPGMASEAKPFDAPDVFDAFLQSVQWNAISSADISALQAPFRAGIDVQDYQLDPVARCLKMPRVSLLIADDVGLGKTIEAGLVTQELLLRGKARDILVVCPADIQIQWQSEMREKFGLEFRIIDAEMMRTLRRSRGLHVNPWTHFPRLICSMDYLKRERPLQLFRETLPQEGEPRFPRRHGLLIVDEAHNIAPSGSSHYAIDSQRTRTIREIAAHFEHKLFLSATPHNGYKESFSALLELLDDQRFARGVEPNREQLAQVLVRRLKSELPPAFDGTPRFPQRVLQAIEVRYSADEKRLHALLNAYSQSRRVESNGDAPALATDFVLKLLKKRLFSSPQAFAQTLQTHRATMEKPREKVARNTKLDGGILRRQIDGLDEANADDLEWEAQNESVVGESSRWFAPLTSNERTLLSEMQNLAEAGASGGDTKSRAFIEWLQNTLRPNGQWNDERVIIFTEYRATQKWLFGLLASAGLAGDGDDGEKRLQVLYGGMELEAREKIKAAFQAHPQQSSVRILLATDAASEGVNLQNHCSRLVHYEIPWNPNRLEQRNGRIDRHGQKAAQVDVFHFVGENYQNQNAREKAPGDLEGDLEFLLRAARKVEQIREDLGKVGPVIATQVQEAMIGKRVNLDTQRAENEASPARRMLKFERDLKKQLSQLRDDLRQTRDELQMRPENIERAVQIALEIAHQPALGAVTLPDGVKAWELPPLSGSWASATLGLNHPHTGKRRPLVFDENMARGRDDVVFAHLGHRLVQLSLSLLRAEIWALAGNSGDADTSASTSNGVLVSRRAKINRVTCRVMKGARFDAPIVIAHGRLVVLGGDNARLHEEVIQAGGALREGRFSRLNVGEVREALSSQTRDEVSSQMQNRLRAMWPQIEKPLLGALENRMRERTQNLEKFLQERAQTESDHLRAVLEELAQSIKDEIYAAAPAQLSLWSDEEQLQLQRNREALKIRLDAIPGEIDRETQNILDRFASPTPRLFPAAVSFLVPEREAR